MDVDEQEEDWEDESEGMDVDGEERAPAKRAKTNSGTVLAKSRQPRTNRQVAGLRDQAVRDHEWFQHLLLTSRPTVASEQGGQTTQPWPKGAELACQSRRSRSPHPYQNGVSAFFP